MNDTLTRSLNLTISLMLPGAVALYGMAFFAAPIEKGLDIAVTPPTSVGAFLFLLLASIGAGLIVGGLRWVLVDELLFDRLLPARLRPNRHGEPDHETRPKGAQTEAVYRSLIADHYMSYQLFSNLFVALLVFWGLWLVATRPAWVNVLTTALGLVVAGLFLLAVAHGCLNLYLKKRFELPRRASHQAPA